MGADGDGTDTSEASRADSTGKTARKIDQLSASLRSRASVITPKHGHLIRQSIKIGFTIALTALLLYWGIAYYFDVVWFEF